MEKEKVTEELVRQNGNQAAAVMADYAGQGGGGGGSVASKGAYGTLVNVYELPCFKPMSDWPLPGDPLTTPIKLSDILADGYRLIHYYSADSHQEEFSFYVVKVTGANPTISLNNGILVFTDCEPVPLGVPSFAPNYIVLRALIFNFSADDTADLVGLRTIEGKDLPAHYESLDETPLVCETVFPADQTANPIIALGNHIIVAEQWSV